MRFTKLMVSGLLLIGALVAPAGVASAQDTGPLYMECLLMPPAQLVGVAGVGGLTVRGANFEQPYDQVRLDFEGRFVGNFVGPVFATTIPLPADAEGSFTATATAYGSKSEERTCRASTTVRITPPPVCLKDCIPATGTDSLPLASFGLAGVAVGIALLLGARFRVTAGHAAQFVTVPVVDAPLPAPVSPAARAPKSCVMRTPRLTPAPSTRPPARDMAAPAKLDPPVPVPAPPPVPELPPAAPSNAGFDNRMQSFLSELKNYSE